jgi:SAM-dependent methyltransferase
MMGKMTASSRARSFNRAAAQYAASRPSYPPALFDVIEEFTSRPLAGTRVADVGAGTGIATVLLRERGAEVIAVEPGDAMASQFHTVLPDVPIVRGDGNALPRADASDDLVTYAVLAVDRHQPLGPEALRVLTPGGAIAIWWNTTAFDVPWIRAQHERITRHCGVKAPAAVRPDDNDAIRLAVLSWLRVARRQVRWSRIVPLDTHLVNISSRSAFLVLPEDSNRAFLAEEHSRLREISPDEAVHET